MCFRIGKSRYSEGSTDLKKQDIESGSQSWTALHFCKSVLSNVLRSTECSCFTINKYAVCSQYSCVPLFLSVPTTLLCAGHEPASAFGKAKLLMKPNLNEELIECGVHTSLLAYDIEM